MKSSLPKTKLRSLTYFLHPSLAKSGTDGLHLQQGKHSKISDRHMLEFTVPTMKFSMTLTSVIKS